MSRRFGPHSSGHQLIPQATPMHSNKAFAIEQALRILVADRPDLKEKFQKAADEATDYDVWNLLGALADCCSKNDHR